MTPKRPRDLNQLAKSMIDSATGQAPECDPTAKWAKGSQSGR
jgi:hypothetical protein